MAPFNHRLFAAVFAAVALVLSPACFTQAQDDAPLDELGEVVVQGKRLMEQIVDAEDEFFKLFNDLNKDDRYDTHCVYLQMREGSHLQSRSCIPGFVADAMADWAPFRARCQPPQEMKYGRDSPEFACLDRNNDGRLSYEEAGAREELAAAFYAIDMEGNKDGSLNGEEFQQATESRSDLSAPTVHMPPSPDVVLVEGTKRWYDHMTSVVNSDPRLRKMASHLGDLYYDLGKAQRRYDELDLATKQKSVKPNSGPRAR